MIVGKDGKNVVEDDIGSYVLYYKDCTKADNHAVREAGTYINYGGMGVNE